MNRRYPSYAAAIASGTSVPDLLSTNVVQAILVRLEDYTPNFATDTVVNDIPGIAQVAAVNLSGSALADGTIDYADLVFAAVAAGDPIDALVIATVTGDPTTDQLLYFLDEFPAGIPITPDGTDIHGVIDAAGLIDL